MLLREADAVESGKVLLFCSSRVTSVAKRSPGKELSSSPQCEGEKGGWEEVKSMSLQSTALGLVTYMGRGSTGHR